MYETFVALLAAHLVADFVLQSNWMVANKRKLRVLASHVLIVGACTALALGARDLTAATSVAIVVATHLIIDFIKTRVGDSMVSFIFDQLAHVAVATLIAIILPALARQGLWSLLPGDAQARYYYWLVVGSGLIATVWVGGILIKKAINPFAPAAAPGTQLPNAGRYIGWLERALTFAFILMRMPEGVGFLLAAKSVLRIGDLKDPSDRSHAEYIIIGTFMSFGWALLIAIVTQGAVAHWSG